MDHKVLISLLATFVVSIHSAPFGFGFKVGGGSDAEIKTNTGYKVKPGVSLGKGLSVDGELDGQVSGKWKKGIFGQVYVLDRNGMKHGVEGSVGSAMSGKADGQVGAAVSSNLLNTSLDKRAGGDVSGTYEARADVHFINDDNSLPTEKVHSSAGGSNQIAADGTANAVKPEEEKGFIRRYWDKIFG